MIHNAYVWAIAHWPLLVAALFVLGTICNAATRVWHDHTGLVRVLTFLSSVFSLVRSRGADDGPLGALKLPLVPEGKGGPKGTPLPFLFGAIALSALLGASGCFHAVSPRTIGPGLKAISWTQEQCQAAQRKKVVLTAVTAGLGALAGAGALTVIFPDDDRVRKGIGISALVVGLASAVTAPFLATATANYADHCVE